MHTLLMVKTGASVQIFDLLVIQNYQLVIVEGGHRWLNFPR